MEGQKLKVVNPLFSESFKRKVIEEYLRTGESKIMVQRRHGIKFMSAICTWMKKYGYEDIHGKKPYIEVLNLVDLKKKFSEDGDNQTNAPDALKKRIRELEKQLENEKLRSEAYRLTIEIAERDLHIPIRKKPNTK